MVTLSAALPVQDESAMVSRLACVVFNEFDSAAALCGEFQSNNHLWSHAVVLAFKLVSHIQVELHAV